MHMGAVAIVRRVPLQTSIDPICRRIGQREPRSIARRSAGVFYGQVDMDADYRSDAGGEIRKESAICLGGEWRVAIGCWTDFDRFL